MASTSDYIPFAARPGWSDLTPIPQADAPNALVPIAYTEKYRDAMDTFRALVKVDEKSERALEVTGVLIRINPGHYSIWAYRAQTLLALQGDLSKELDLMDELVREHIKSYQVWQHRRTIVTALNSGSREIPFTTRALSFDSKNYHTWAYRQWALCYFFSPSASSSPSYPVPTVSPEDLESIWAGELAYVDELLVADIRNNSAWNHRFFVTMESSRAQSGDSAATLVQEIAYSKSKLALAPNNPSAWNYLRGILTHTTTPLSLLIPFVSPLAILSSAPSAAADDPPISDKAQLPAPLAIEFLADAMAQEGREKGAQAAELFRSLVQFDPIRSKYWEFRAEESVGVKVQ